MARSVRILLAAAVLLPSFLAAQAPPVVWDTTHEEWDRAEIATVAADGGAIEVAALRNKRVPDAFGQRSSFVQVRFQRDSTLANLVVPAAQIRELGRALRTGEGLPAVWLDAVREGPGLIVRRTSAGVALQFACAESGCRPTGSLSLMVQLDDSARVRLGGAVTAAVRAFGDATATMPHIGELYYPTAVHLRDLDRVNVFGAVNGPALGAPSLGSEIIELMAGELAAAGVTTEGRNRSTGPTPSLVFTGRCVEDGAALACYAALQLSAGITVRRTAESSAAGIWGATDTLFVTPKPEAAEVMRAAAERMMAEFVMQYRLVNPVVEGDGGGR